MHFFYLDETGCTGADLANAQQPIFVLGGVSVRDEGWVATNTAVAGVLNDYFGGAVPAGFELHATDLLSPEGIGPFAGHDRLRRNQLAKDLLAVLVERRHQVHYVAIDKPKLAAAATGAETALFNTRVPYLLGYNYLLTYIEKFTKEKLGRSARGMIILDTKEQFHEEIAAITHFRRYTCTQAHRMKWVVEFSYPIDSATHPMIQLSDLVIYCVRKFLEVEGGYGAAWPPAAKNFFAQCFDIISEQVEWKTVVDQGGRDAARINALMGQSVAQHARQWRRRYELAA